MGQPAKLFYVRSNRTLRLNRFSTFLGELGLLISFNGLEEYFNQACVIFLEFQEYLV